MNTAKGFTRAAALSLVLVATSAQAYWLTGMDLKAACDNDTRLEYAECQGYVEGVFDASSVLRSGSLERRDGMTDYSLRGLRWCLPNEFKLGQATAITDKWLKAHPETWHLPASLLVARSMQDAFPCPD